MTWIELLYSVAVMVCLFPILLFLVVMFALVGLAVVMDVWDRICHSRKGGKRKGASGKTDLTL
jgi:hypothetical protein